MGPLLVIADLLVAGRESLVLLPAIPRQGLSVVPGDTIELFSEETGREEVTLLALEPDRSDPSCVRLRIGTACRVSPGMEVWPGESQSRVVRKPQVTPPRTERPARGTTTIAGALVQRPSRAR